MSDPMFFTKSPGSPVSESAPDEVPGVLIADTTAAEWVRLPPDLGGATVRVKEHYRAMCLCRGGVVTHLVLDEPSGICVAECLHGRGFMWYRPRSA